MQAGLQKEYSFMRTTFAVGVDWREFSTVCSVAVGTIMAGSTLVTTTINICRYIINRLGAAGAVL